MNPDVLLTALGALAGFLLKTTAAFVVCVALSWMVRLAKARFAGWMIFLFGAAGYWMWLLTRLRAPGVSGTGSPVPAMALSFHAPNVHAWQLPETWAPGLEIGAWAAAIVYLCVFATLLFSHLKKRLHLKWVMGFAIEPPGQFQQAFALLTHSLRIKRTRLLVLPGAPSPATFGWFRPTVLLPALCLEQDPTDLEDVLRHELQHVRRGDSAWNGLAVVCRALLWFHPAAWYAVRQLQRDRELACDREVVVQSPSRRVTYAECLLRFARLNVTPDPRNWGVDFAAPPDHLTVRVHSILAETRREPGWSTGLRIVSGLMLTCLFVIGAPSLAILLTYAHSPASEVTVKAPSSALVQAVAARRRMRTPAKTRPEGRATAGPVQSKEPVADETNASIEAVPLRAEAAGVHLQRRPLTTAPAGYSQSIALVDTDSEGHAVKSQGHDLGQTMQQTATAVSGIFRQATEANHR